MKIFKNNSFSFLKNSHANFFFLRNLIFLSIQKKKKIKILNSNDNYPEFFRVKKQKNIDTFANIFMRCGKKLKYILIIFKIFKKFYYFLKKNNSYFKNFENFYKLSSTFDSFKNLFSINFFFDWLINLLSPKFDLQCLIVPKKYRKKLKCKFIFKLKYIKNFKKNKKVMKWLYLYNLKFSNYSVSDRVFNSIVYTFFEDKKSFLYNKKLIIYKKMLSKSKTN